MVIKKEGYNDTVLTLFDLIDNNHHEIALTKALAFVVSKNSKALFMFLQRIGVHANNTVKNYSGTTVVTELSGSDGRTDIEIKLGSVFHVIIEAKVNSNKLRSTQKGQYIPRFYANCAANVMCFSSQYKDTNIDLIENVRIVSLSWIDIINLFECKKLQSNELIKDFTRFVMKKFKVNDQKEILIQNLGVALEIDRYCNHNVYRRPEISKRPLYFAPYFTRGSKNTHNENMIEGITKLSRIMGILTIQPHNVNQYEDDLKEFVCTQKTGETYEAYDTRRQATVTKWIGGVTIGNTNADNQTDYYTYYFLEEPLTLTNPLRKDSIRDPNKDKSWIAGMIPPNLCISFDTFMKRVMKSYELPGI